ncbi:hypothetical protein RKE25_22210 (plasmid) [Dyella sp. BiH032]|uniref:hypothetical protein n=1 Tax=Dyella sp. BiH032 TaxID=3075430 RepID=UPI0028932672|nr:hypothetical protein [Dyella sp. BiH032]WNL48446.1 hypothetical protein RKE25_22210 [Dyella sp. BiH032]
MQLGIFKLQSAPATLDVRAVVSLTRFAMHAGFDPGSEILFADQVGEWATEWQGLLATSDGIADTPRWKQAFEDFAADKLHEVRHLCNA